VDVAAETDAVARLADALSIETIAVAAGIHRLINTRMADGVRVATVRRGVDPRRHALLAFGGAAGLHVAAVAAELGIGRVVVPLAASVLSAWGMLNTDLRIELARSQAQRSGIDVTALQAAFAAMEREGRERLGWFDGEVTVHRSADMRYGEQVFEIAVPLDAMDFAAPNVAAEIEAAFHARHEALYTYSLPDQDVVLVNARASVVGRLPPAPVVSGNVAAASAAEKSRRRVHLGSWTEVPVYDFAAIAAGQTLAGPAIVDSDTTTVLLRPGDTAQFDARGWLDITIG
jgi:N-methylhydantoinase A